MEQLKNINNSSENSQNIQITAQPNYEIETAPNFPILNDVYSKLKNQHYDSEKFTAS